MNCYYTASQNQHLGHVGNVYVPQGRIVHVRPVVYNPSYQVNYQPVYQVKGQQEWKPQRSEPQFSTQPEPQNGTEHVPADTDLVLRVNSKHKLKRPQPKSQSQSETSDTDSFKEFAEKHLRNGMITIGMPPRTEAEIAELRAKEAMDDESDLYL
jgi:hypothetical protein